jgi:hypothetical protein
MQALLEGCARPDEDIAAPREAPESIVAGCAPLKGGGSIVAHDDHEVVVAVPMRGVARVRAEEVDALGMISGHESGDDLSEEGISCARGERRAACCVFGHDPMLAGLTSVRRSRCRHVDHVGLSATTAHRLASFPRTEPARLAEALLRHGLRTRERGTRFSRPGGSPPSRQARGRCGATRAARCPPDAAVSLLESLSFC